MKFWVTILAILIGAAVILGVMSQSRQANAPGDRSTVVTDDAGAASESAVSTETTEADLPAVETDHAAEPGADKADTPVAAGTDADNEPAPTADLQATDETAAAESTHTAEPETTEPAEPVEAIQGLHAVEVTDGRNVTIGSNENTSPFKLKVQLSKYGAAVVRISLTDYVKTVGQDDKYIVLDELRLPEKEYPEWYAYAAKAVTVNGTRIPLETNDVWSTGDVKTHEQSSSVSYTATIADAEGTPLLKIVRTYAVTADSYDLSLDQKLINLSNEPLEVRLEQNLQGDLVNDSGYLGDRRKYIAGYFAPWWDKSKAGIYTQGAEQMRSKLISSKKRDIWPPYDLNPEAELVWIGSLNRYFAVVTHAALSDQVTTTANVPPLDSLFPTIDHAVTHPANLPEPKGTDKLMIIKAASGNLSVPAGGETDLDLGIFAGPRKPELFDSPPYSILHLDQTIIYSLGGMCSFCTFQWLAHILLWLLKLFEGQVLILGGIGIGVHDWGISIILLVALVRLMLHPITKRAQFNMMKMGKMMQTIQPEVEKVKKKYKDDQQKINAEMMKLYREKGVNPANMLGCLPMFLQTPIWIALYAMLYYAIELRHEPAFWGLFQMISGGHWGFLADLSRADNFLMISDTPVKLNLLFIHPHFQAINILPILMAVVFYFNQKLTTPPATNDQQAQQQKMMKFVVFLFPIFLYSAPSGLTLYILASTTAGVIDSAIVRRHIKQQEESGELFAKKPTKPGSLRDRISKAVESKQAQLSAQQQRPSGGGKKRKRR